MAILTILALVLLCVIGAQAAEIPVTQIPADQELLSPLGSSLPPNSNSTCSVDGIFAVPGNCTAYIICKDGQERRRQCPDGFLFDSVMYCTPDETADCGVLHLRQQTENLCPSFYGIFPHPDDCHKYVVCHEGRGRVKTCPEGTVYRNNIGCVDGDMCPPADNLELEAFKVSETDVCDLPLETGPCNGKIPRFYYDSESMQCKRFVYGGCRGNENNFRRLSKCEETCMHKPVSERNVCDLPLETGPCYANITRYFYDSESMQCKRFIYGGCSGNGNNFRKLSKCEEACMDKPDASEHSVCELQSRAGPCYGHFPRYYYDSESMICKQFIYGGCRGNENNFKTVDECKERCVREIEKEGDYKEFNCKESGRFANPNNCDSYMECFVSPGHSEMKLVQCPNDQHYNMETKTCDDKCNAQCDQELACTCRWPHCSITCRRPNGVFPVPTNCRLYLQCRYNKPVVLRCPDGKAFDPEMKECVNIEDTNCVTEINDIWRLVGS